MQRCRLAGTATGRRSRGFGRRGGLAMWCTAARCCPMRCLHRRRVRPASSAAGCGAACVVARGGRVDGVGDGLVLLPFEWSEVTLVATGARELRVRASVEREWRGRSLGAAAAGRWQRAGGGAGWRAAAEGSERSANPRGGAQRGAASVPAGVASGGVERGRGGSDATS